MKITKIIEWEPEDKLTVNANPMLPHGLYFVIGVTKMANISPSLRIINQQTGKIFSIDAKWFDVSGTFITKGSNG